ncbi:hypothetical protein EDM53_03930 [Rickettsiales endosymbiont of Peranema trichophorum]|nr:hypothetical protein EDM53_03930 [Rickettsiales endosymbiont of Peranema trichophorum]
MIISQLLLQRGHIEDLLTQHNPLLNFIIDKSTASIEFIMNTVEDIQRNIDEGDERASNLALGLKGIKQFCVDALVMVGEHSMELYTNQSSTTDVSVDALYKHLKELDGKVELMLPRCVYLITSVWVLLQEIDEKIKGLDLYEGQAIRMVRDDSEVDFVFFRNFVDEYGDFTKKMTRILRRLWSSVLLYKDTVLMRVVHEVISSYGSEERGRIEVTPLYNIVGPIKRVDCYLFRCVFDDVLRNALKYSDGKIEVQAKPNEIEVRDYGYKWKEHKGMLYSFWNCEAKEYGDMLSYSRLMMIRGGGEMKCEVSGGCTVFTLSFNL